MIQSTLFFLLGFLTAGFLALMVAPALWRRAVTLTRRRIEASVPLTLNEIQADKDRMRAEFAMSTRRLEMSVKEFRDKAGAQVIEINRSREELKTLAAERAEKNQALSDLEAKAGELRGELRQREDQLQRLQQRLGEADRLLEGKALEMEKLGRLYDEASFASSSRQIEIVARETEVDKLTGDVSELKSQRKDADRRLQEVAAENKTAREALKAEKRNVAELERKLERMLATLADRDEKLDRREKELARLRDRLKGNAESEDELSGKLTEALAEKLKLESEVADLTLQVSTLLSSARGGDIEKAMERLTADRDRQEARLVTLTRENKKLKDDLQSVERAKSQDWTDERRENALLREQMNDLAAEVVNLTAMLEGPDSPIAKALAAPAPRSVSNGEPAQITSIADRVKALQKAASAG